VDTKGYQGKINKKAKVFTNDPLHNVEVLNLTAFVKVPIHLSTKYVILKGPAAQPITKTVKLTAKKDRPLKLEPVDFNLSKKVTYKIEEVEAGKIFQIHFTSIPGHTERYHGFLKLKTNYPEKPEITIRIRALFKG
jgi:hypothetical protein